MPLDAINPESPAIFSILGVGVVGFALLLPVIAFFSIWRRHERMELTHVLIWIAIVVFAPFVGSLIWLTVGTRLHPEAGGDRLPASAMSPRFDRL